jgi:transposase-like protein
LVSVVQEAYVAGVSTRKVDQVVEEQEKKQRKDREQARELTAA